jgi:di/tricarboxylate transporter
LRKIRGLVTNDDQARKLQVPAWKRTLVEAVVSPRCDLLGKTIREGNFRSHYNAAVVAVARGDKKLEGKLGDVALEVGDVLLLEASPSFLHRRSESRDFFLVSQVDGAKVLRPERAVLAIGILLGMVIASAAGMPIVTAAIVATVLMIGFRCCTSGEAVRSVDWNVLIVIGAAFAVGSALETSGAAKSIAGQVVSFAGENKLLVLATIYLTTAVITEMITNNAAALLMLGIASTTATQIGVDPEIMVLAVMIAASASFLTPFGYQTNTMVYTVGGYRPLDYLRFGLPLSFIVFTVTMVVLGSRLESPLGDEPAKDTQQVVDLAKDPTP